jgi:6-phosphogluconate dehydrogenase
MAAMQGASRIQVVDISETQIAFCKHIWTNWTGQDYGTFAWNFIQNNKIKHFELDLANLNQIDRAGYYIQHNFISHVNQAFETIQNNHNIIDPCEQWKRAKTHCDVQFVQDNIIEYAITNDVYEHIWHTNVTDYKWSRLKTSPAHIEQFKKICNEKRNN